MARIRTYFLGADGRKGIKNLGEVNLLQNLQNQVGGYLEPIRVFEDNDIVVLVNEEGKRLNLPDNPFLLGIKGNAVIIGQSGTDMVSVSSNKIEILKKLFGKGGKE